MEARIEATLSPSIYFLGGQPSPVPPNSKKKRLFGIPPFQKVEAMYPNPALLLDMTAQLALIQDGPGIYVGIGQRRPSQTLSSASSASLRRNLQDRSGTEKPILLRGRGSEHLHTHCRKDIQNPGTRQSSPQTKPVQLQI